MILCYIQFIKENLHALEYEMQVIYIIYYIYIYIYTDNIFVHDTE